VKEALKGTDSAAIKTAGEKLNETWQAVSAELYKAASEKARRSQGTSGGERGVPPEPGERAEDGRPSDEPVFDAEVVDEEKIP
jgi:molecular chaperone DnaK